MSSGPMSSAGWDDDGAGWDDDRLARRRAVEALRSGVPSGDAVTTLGSGQSEIEDRLAGLLADVEEGAPDRGQASLLLGGGFGSGKSHLLTHLGHLASAAGFVVSTVVVSKETPLHDPAKMLRAAVESAVAPGGIRDVIADAAAELDPDNPRYGELLRWVRSPEADLDPRFDATLLLHSRLGGDVPGVDEQFVEAIVRFWSGDPLPMPDLRRQLKVVGAGKTYTFSTIKARDLARQRLRFLPRLLRTAGYSGWVILVDEVELIGRYSLLQRGRAYAELARWIDGEPQDTGAPVVVVLAMTDDFEAAVLSGKKDREQVPTRLRAKQTAEYDELASLAQAGMRHIERGTLALVPPDDAELDRAYGSLKQLHAQAYGWQPPDVPGLERLGATRMRQYVRAWINEWDLLRLDPTYRPDTRVEDVVSDYRAQDELEDDDEDG